VKTLVIFCHPSANSVAAAVLDTSVAALHAAGHEVRVTDLYAEGFDPVFSAHDHEHLKIIESKLDAVGFGFLIPLFFVVSGMKFDLDALTHDASAIAKVPLFLVLMLVVRGVPVMVLYRKALTAASRRAVALMTSAGLPLVVVITTIGVDSGRMKPANAAALVGAGMLSVLVFPLVGLAQLKREAPETQAANAAR
jgi:Kef-type K+ transport system membrane component KefB